MQIEKYGYKWTKKESGYYQSTTNFKDGTRHWLHQEIYLKEVGELKAGYSIHHKDENKDNNISGNLEQLSHSKHNEHHMSCSLRRKSCSNNIKNNNIEMQKLVVLAKKGEYIGKQKLRKISKNNKKKKCAYCSKLFVLKETDRNDTKYCSNTCSQRGSKLTRNSNFIPLPEKAFCKICNIPYKPKAPNQNCCGNTCSKQFTELKRKSKKESRNCIKCGDVYETIKSSKRKYCTDACRKTGNKKYS